MLKLKFSMLNTECSEDDFTELTCNKEVYYSFGEDDALVIGEFVNDFMKAAGYVFNKDYIIRFNNINGFNMDLEPRGNMILVKNTDVPGVIGSIGNTIAQHNVNIADFRLGRNGDLHTKEALALILVDSPISQSLLDALCAIPECISVRSVLM